MEPQRAADVSEPSPGSGSFELPIQPGFQQGSGPIPGLAPASPGGGGGLSASELAFGDPPRSVVDRPTVRNGSTGPAVVDLQARLNWLGESLAIDGVFGPLTRAAVVRSSARAVAIPTASSAR